MAEEVARDDARVGRVLAFGSVARGDAAPGSDLDLVVLLSGDLPDDAREAELEVDGRVRRRCGFRCDVIVRTEQQWEHLISNVSASFDAAIAGEATELFARASSGGAAGAPNGSVEGVALDNLDPAAAHLKAAVGEMESIAAILKALPDAEARSIPERVAQGITTVAEERRRRCLSLLADAHLAIELAVKCVICAEGGSPWRSHDVDELIDTIKDRSARQGLDAAVSTSREPDGRMRRWRVGVYEADSAEWQASISAANAAEHIGAAVAAVKTAAGFLEERATRHDHTSAATLARMAANSVEQAASNETSLATGAGLFTAQT